MPHGGPRLRTVAGLVNGVGGRVRERMAAMRLTQLRLAARIEDETAGGWKPTEDEVYKLLRGTRIVSDLELRVLARVLDCTPLDLLGEDPPLAPEEPDAR